MEIAIESAVECVDGDVGKITGLIIDRASMKLLWLVVSKGRIVPQDIVVPMETVRNVEPNRVYLRLTIRELGEEYHRLKESEYVPIGNDWEIPPPDSPEELVITSLPAVGSEAPLVPIQSDLGHPFLLRELTNIPEGTVKVDGETRILCPEGPVGNLERLLFDPTTNRATHIVTRLYFTPHLLVAVPVGVVERLEEGSIYLKARRVFIESLPTSPQVSA